MSKFELKILAYSIAITGLISVLFGFAGSSIIGTFWSWFCISFLIQFLGFVLYNSFLIQKDNIALQDSEVEALRHISKMSIKITCAYCQTHNVTPIQFNRRNTFKCESCNQVNGVSIQFSSTAITTPLESVKIPVDENESIEFVVNN